MNSHAKFRGAARRGFSVIYEKSPGGADIHPPPVGARARDSFSRGNLPILDRSSAGDHPIQIFRKNETHDTAMTCPSRKSTDVAWAILETTGALQLPRKLSNVSRNGKRQ